MSEQFSRREMMKIVGASTALGAAGLPARFAGASPAAADDSSVPLQRHRVLRLAHMTDVHVEPERRADEGLIACLHHVQNLPDPPQLILNGGDAVFDTWEADDSRTQQLWNLWRSTLKNECSLPLEHGIGNHDIWGIDKRLSHATGKEPNFGKQRAMDNYGLSERFRSFDRAGWHFIVLDSTQPDSHGYTAYLDEPQFEWLANDLKAVHVATPVLILSHIPILSVTVFLFHSEKRTDWNLSGGLMHLDAVRLKDLFNRHKNVKLCLSGHIHMVDRADYNGVTYLCDGAVSGNWWKGRHKECSEGYAVIDLYNDGTFERDYVTYGWVAQP